MFDKFPLQSEIAAQKSIAGKNYEFFNCFKSQVMYSIFVYARYSAWETFI